MHIPPLSATDFEVMGLVNAMKLEVKKKKKKFLDNGAYSIETKMVEPYHFRKVSASR